MSTHTSSTHGATQHVVDFSNSPGFTKHVTQRGVSVTHITTRPGLSRRAALLSQITRGLQHHKVKVVYVVPSEIEAGMAERYLADKLDNIRVTGLENAANSMSEPSLLVSYSHNLFKLLVKKEELEKLVPAPRCLFVLEYPVVSHSFWPEATAEFLLHWMCGKSKESVGLVTLSTWEPDALRSKKVSNWLGVVLTEEVIRVLGLRSNSSSCPSPRRKLSIVCVVTSYQYRQMVDRILGEFATNTVFINHFPIKTDLDGVWDLWEAFCSSTWHADADHKVIGIDPECHFMYPGQDIGVTDIFVVESSVRTAFNSTFGGAVGMTVPRSVAEMRQAEMYGVMETVGDAGREKARVHYYLTSETESEARGIDRKLRDDDDISIDELFLKSQLFPEPSLSPWQLQQAAAVSYPRAVQWTMTKLEIVTKSMGTVLSDPGKSLYQIMVVGENVSLQTALWLAPCLSSNTSDRVKRILIIMAAIQMAHRTKMHSLLGFSARARRGDDPHREDLEQWRREYAGPTASQGYKGGLWLLVGLYSRFATGRRADLLGLNDALDAAAQRHVGCCWTVRSLVSHLSQIVAIDENIPDDWDDEVPLSAREVLEIEQHMVRASLFELIRFVGVVSEGEAHAVSTKTRVRWERRDFFADTERLRRENGGEVFMVPRSVLKERVGGQDVYTAYGLTGVSREAVWQVHQSIATGALEGYSLDLILRPTVMMRDYAQYSLSLELR
ncbi:hypothetical protein B0T19DRAFT_404824 [Cercophora scortea]|uniref:Uncharacterized protein n=1 Tax=Cercophora scortea TaxID=314031 RepID=A0AAE0I8A5_9PEZI|nr:hypothetical protein B0T19DRAFT_404824 [Cercophora scortea]